MNKLMGLIFLTGAMALVACKQESASTTTASAATKPAPAPAAAEKPAAKPAAAAGDADSIGVAECDDYIAAMKACLDKMPAAAKEASESAFKQSIAAWKAAAGTEAGKAGLVTACKTSLDAVKSNPACQ